MALDMETAPTIVAETSLSSNRLVALSNRVTTDGDDTIAVHAPATDTEIGTVPACSEADVAAAVDRARSAQADWADRPVAERAEIVDRFGELVLDARAELLDILQLETGKSRSDGVGELFDVPQTCSYYADRGPAQLADEQRQGAVPLATTATVTSDPVGVVGVISPWNFPLNLSMTDLIPALVAGNAVVLKPDEKTPYIALALAELLEDAGLPEDVLQVVTGDGPVVGPAVIDRVDYLAFTGGTETGRLVAEQAGRNLIDCSLELGGKNPLVVLDDADIETAARGAASGCFANAGQLCLAAERIYVEETLYEPFCAAFVEATRDLALGTGFDFDADVGSLIDADQLDRVESRVESAREAGATVLTGGRRRPDIGPFCYEPTILADVDPDATIACEETFGPVVSIEPVADAETAIERANDSDYGLNASVWTGDRTRGRAVAREIDCGTVCINDAFAVGWAATDAPMGGIGDSGLGRRHGPEGIAHYREQKTIATSNVGPLEAPPGIPTAWYVRGMAGLARLQRRLRSVTDRLTVR